MGQWHKWPFLICLHTDYLSFTLCCILCSLEHLHMLLHQFSIRNSPNTFSYYVGVNPFNFYLTLYFMLELKLYVLGLYLSLARPLCLIYATITSVTWLAVLCQIHSFGCYFWEALATWGLTVFYTMYCNYKFILAQLFHACRVTLETFVCPMKHISLQ